MNQYFPNLFRPPESEKNDLPEPDFRVIHRFQGTDGLKSCKSEKH